MNQVSALQRADAKAILPPAAHRADRFLTEFADLITDLGDTRADLERCLEVCPHDKAEILRLFDNFKKKAMTFHGQAVSACQDIRNGR